MLSPLSRTDPFEEQLRTWAGGILSGGPDCGTPPGTHRGLVSDFVRAHGIELLLPGRAGDGAAQDRPQPDDEAVKSAVAAEMARKNEFVHVIGALRPAGLVPVIFKGQALAYSAYPQPWLRPRTDIDALIDRPGFETMVNILASLGYERTVAIDADLVLPQLSLRKHRHGVSHVWDVHWRISNRPALAEALTFAEILANSVETRIDGIAFRTPDRVYNLLIGCLHLIGHHADEIRLIWLYDLHLLIASMTDPEYQRFLDRSRQSAPLRAACHAALALTQRYLPTERTDALCRTLDPGAGARWKMDRTYLSGLVADARAVDQGKRLRLLAQHVFPSADYMMKRFGIRHRWQLPFWYAVRIGRAVPKLFQRR